MSITIVTGTPGAGKTLYTVSKLVKQLVGKEIQHGDEMVPRTVYTNINGLLLDHEKIDAGGTWSKDAKTGAVKFVGNSGGLRDWHQWAKPGSVIVYDEAQKTWEPRPVGSWVPPDIQALETHRHMGVDFILITQGLPLLERNLSMLCNRHLHVRRVANMPFAVVYEWDHASRSLMYSKSITNEKWLYDRKAYKLYKSAEVHTKQKRGTPKALVAALAGIMLLAVIGPYTYHSWGQRFGWVDAPKVSADVKKAPTGPGNGPAGASDKPKPVEAAGGGVAVVQAEQKFSGCIATKNRCSCLDSGGQLVDKGPLFCQVHTVGDDGPPIKLDHLVIPDQVQHERELARLESGDRDLIAWASLRESKVSRETSIRNQGMSLPRAAEKRIQ